MRRIGLPGPGGPVRAAVIVVPLIVAAVIVAVAVVAVVRPVLRDEATTPTGFVPSASDPDPTSRISGVVKEFYRGGHVGPGKRVAYRHSPPFGGRHDAVWATCTGIVYPRAIRSENAVHSLEHGAVWVSYDPARLGGEQIASLARRVEGRDHTMMSPYPGQRRPISIQAWGHQLMVDRADDPRIDQFITATRQNPQIGVYPDEPTAPGHPEVGGTCAGNGVYDLTKPPAFDWSPSPKDAIPES